MTTYEQRQKLLDVEKARLRAMSRRLRIMYGYSQQNFAELCEVTQEQISLFERDMIDSNKIHEHTLNRLYREYSNLEQRWSSKDT